jgi:NAD(P)-dependent dehydrogenase (short-subunit alcohol dehydrogenase family)
MDPKGKVAIITGGARIGQTVAETLAQHGCALALIYRGSREAAEKTVTSAKAAGVNAIALKADARNEQQIAAAVKETLAALGRVDILVNMAATYVKTPDPSEVDWTDAMESNARSAFLFATHAARAMKEHGAGRIINISDWLTVSGRPRYKGYVPYYTSKAAVTALTESLALELAPEVLVNAIAPGPILAPPDFTAEQTASVIDATPLRRWGGAEEIARAAMFLIETEFVTGECIRVDGGRHLF